jgi:hypothetical protein
MARTSTGTQTDRSDSWLPLAVRRVAFDVSMVNPTAVSHSGAGACGESFRNPNAGTRAAEETKTNKYKLLCQQRGMNFVSIVFTTSGPPGGMGLMGEQFQRRYWDPHWIRVAEAREDEAMKIGPCQWVARKRKAFWEARFAVAVANCNAAVTPGAQHDSTCQVSALSIPLIEPSLGLLPKPVGHFCNSIKGL